MIVSRHAADAGDSYFGAARDAARWLEANALRTRDGLVWPADPSNRSSIDQTLYSGTPGPVLFFLDLHEYTGIPAYSRIATAGGDALLASVDDVHMAGLYSGLAGIAFAVGATWRATGERKYLNAAERCIARLREMSQTAGDGVAWGDTTDIIDGGSGIGLVLLWGARELDSPYARDLAAAAGRRLIELAQHPAPGQSKWIQSPAFAYDSPNFAHGTAGVAYFLATLAMDTGRREFLDAALAGASYLLAIADTREDGCLVYHDDRPIGRDLYYLGWCHGPVGTARLFYRLYQATGDAGWMGWVDRAGHALVASGIPNRVVIPGDWNNVSVCCGIAGQGQFLLSLYRLTADPRYLALALEASDLLLAKSTRDETGTRWVQAEYRVKPDLLAAQTGYMQGASGIGMWLLHMSAFARNDPGRRIVLPDNPFPD